MSSNTNPVSAPSEPSATETTTTTSTTTTSKPATFNAATSISSMADLKEKAPDVYNAMMQGIAMTICNEMKHHQDKLKEMQRQAERDAEGKS